MGHWDIQQGGFCFGKGLGGEVKQPELLDPTGPENSLETWLTGLGFRGLGV